VPIIDNIRDTIPHANIKGKILHGNIKDKVLRGNAKTRFFIALVCSYFSHLLSTSGNVPQHCQMVKGTFWPLRGPGWPNSDDYLSSNLFWLPFRQWYEAYYMHRFYLLNICLLILL
jgi:hypothetical protein